MKNLFTGLWINTDRSVAKGDWVKIAGKEGQIMEVTWRTTRLMTRENDCIYIPNRLLAEDLLENYTFPTPLHIV
jgi:branched-chain amino acid transport system substrate-binding protein